MPVDLGASEIVVFMEAANEGEAQRAAIAACSLPLNGELIDFAVCEPT
jgi:hypothetical protein